MKALVYRVLVVQNRGLFSYTRDPFANSELWLSSGPVYISKCIIDETREIRIQSAGQYRVIYLATLTQCIAVLHAFRKKTRRTSQSDLQRARHALKQALKRSRQ